MTFSHLADTFVQTTYKVRNRPGGQKLLEITEIANMKSYFKHITLQEQVL